MCPIKIPCTNAIYDIEYKCGFIKIFDGVTTRIYTQLISYDSSTIELGGVQGVHSYDLTCSGINVQNAYNALTCVESSNPTTNPPNPLTIEIDAILTTPVLWCYEGEPYYVYSEYKIDNITGNKTFITKYYESKTGVVTIEPTGVKNIGSCVEINSPVIFKTGVFYVKGNGLTGIKWNGWNNIYTLTNTNLQSVTVFAKNVEDSANIVSSLSQVIVTNSINSLVGIPMLNNTTETYSVINKGILNTFSIEATNFAYAKIIYTYI
jgi:hypothetical protein